MLIFTLLFSMMFGQSEIDPSTFYCKTNYELKILKLSNDDLIFYGSEGGILRTTDAGNSWKQNYSGTQDKILKLIEHKNIIYGVTQTGSFMISDDNGDYWKYHKLTNIITDFTILNDIIYVATNSDTIYISSDFGMTWEAKKQNVVTNIKGISKINNKLILLGNNTNMIFILNQDLTLSEESMTPFSYPIFIDKFEDIYIQDGRRIAKLNSDLTWETYIIFNNTTSFKFYPTEKAFAVFVYNTEVRFNPKIDFYKYDYDKSVLEHINSYINNQMNVSSFFYDEFKTVDIEKINDDFILSNHHKTILKVDNNFNWNLLCNAGSKTGLNFIKDFNNITYGSGFGLVNSSDYGTTYQFKPLPKVNFLGEEIRISSQIIEYLDNNEIFILLSSIGLKDTDLDISNVYRFAYSDKNLSSIKVIEKLFNAPFLTPSQQTTCLGIIDNKPIINRSFKMRNTIIGENNIRGDSLIYNCIYELNTNEEKLDSLYTIIDSIQIPHLYYDNEKIWIYGTNSITLKKVKIYLSENGGKTFNYFTEIDLSIDGENYPTNPYYSSLRRSKNGNLYLLSEFHIAKINESDFSYEIIPYNNYNLFVTNILTYSGYLEDCIYLVNLSENDNQTISYAKLEIDNNNIKHKKIFTRNNLMSMRFNNQNEYLMLVQSVEAKYARLFFPIEPERLEYYASSVERGGPPPIWTYPPYPNPVRDRLKMKFYSAMMSEIAKLKVELIHIGTGRSYQIEQYDLNILDDYWGEIEIDVSGYIRGAYLIYFKLGDGNKSESIIIE